MKNVYKVAISAAFWGLLVFAWFLPEIVSWVDGWEEMVLVIGLTAIGLTAVTEWGIAGKVRE